MKEAFLEAWAIAGAKIFSTQSVKIMMAGAIGGLVRWLALGRQGMAWLMWSLYGFGQLLIGLACSYYGWHLVLLMVRRFVGDIPPAGDDPSEVVLCGFIAGVMGMSVIRIAVKLADMKFSSKASEVLDEAAK